jgi:hypothetical protein
MKIKKPKFSKLWIAISKHFNLISEPVVLSKIGEPLLVRFMAANVPMKMSVDKPTSSGVALQVFDKYGKKQLGTIKRLRVEWVWDTKPSGVLNIAEIERYMLFKDFDKRNEHTHLDREARNTLRSAITTPEDLK